MIVAALQGGDYIDPDELIVHTMVTTFNWDRNIFCGLGTETFFTTLVHLLVRSLSLRALGVSLSYYIHMPLLLWFVYVHVALCPFNTSTAAPNAKASVTFQITPVVRGQKKKASLVITAESDQIKGIMGAVDVLIV